MGPTWFFKYLGYALLFVALVIGIKYAYCKFSYIDERVTKGTAYGFSTGADKNVVFQVAAKEFKGELVFLRPLKDGSVFSPPEKTEFTDDEFKVISKYDNWEMSNHEWHQDYLQFKFKEDKLISIWRYRNNCNK